MTAAAKPKRKTVAELEAAIADLEARRKHAMDAADNYKRAVVSAEEEVKQVRAQFADLKERLANAEAVNQRMRGYIARVNEDDVVREELIAIGDPGGEQNLVPKRKPTAFREPSAYSELTAMQGGDSDHSRGRAAFLNRDRPKPKHWVTY